jgi:hypothetical protein
MPSLPINRVLSVVTHGVFGVAIAASALSLAMLQAWQSPTIPGAAPGYHYLALGYRRANGIHYSGLLSEQVFELEPLLPPGFGLGMAFGSRIALGTRPQGPFTRENAVTLIGGYLNALHVQPLVGRLISAGEQRRGAAVTLISEPLAQRLFGSPQSAVGRSVFTRHGFELRVIGVMPQAFRGGLGDIGHTRANLWVPYTVMVAVLLGRWPKGLPKPDMVAALPILGPAALLSVPRRITATQLALTLRRLRKSAAGILPPDVKGFVTHRPYSPFPAIERARARRIRLAMAIAFGTLAIAALNLLVVAWLVWLRRRATLRIERVLGARRAYLLKRFALDALASLVFVLAVSFALVAGAVLVLRRFAPRYAGVLTRAALAPTLSWLIPVLALVVVLAKVLPLAVLLRREALETERMATLTQADRSASATLIGLEVMLAALLTVAASWSISYAWRIHQTPLGFLARPATLMAMRWAGPNLAIRHAGPQARLALDRISGVTHALAPGAAVGIGPTIESSHGFEFPRAVRAGKTVTSACTAVASTGWLRAVGAHLQAGQLFPSGRSDGGAVLIDTQVARTLFGSPGAALGRTLQVARRPERVIGVLAPMHLRGGAQPACPLVVEDLRAHLGQMLNPSTLAIGAALPPGERELLRHRFMQVLTQSGLSVQVEPPKSTRAERAWLASPESAQARLFAGIALFAWIVALSGVFAQLRLFLVTRKRVRAIHAALGASPRWMYRRVLGATLALAASGMALTLLVLPWLARQFEFLSGAQASPYGAASGIAFMILWAAVAAVAHGPARLAAREAPAESLHEL